MPVSPLHGTHGRAPAVYRDQSPELWGVGLAHICAPAPRTDGGSLPGLMERGRSVPQAAAEERWGGMWDGPPFTSSSRGP